MRREGSEVTEAALPIDFERLFKLRLAVARHGEMDVAGWWNTGASWVAMGPWYCSAVSHLPIPVPRTGCLCRRAQPLPCAF